MMSLLLIIMNVALTLLLVVASYAVVSHCLFNKHVYHEYGPGPLLVWVLVGYGLMLIVSIIAPELVITSIICFIVPFVATTGFIMNEIFS